jgi:OOP family OmpA-OmpF porin
VPAATGVIEGHTDSNGADAYNQRLSEQRAKAVRDYMVSMGIDPARLEAKGYGESQPVADNATPEGRAQNRRVVLRRTDQQ